MAKPWAQIRVRERSGVHIFVLNQGGTAELQLPSLQDGSFFMHAAFPAIGHPLGGR